MFRVQEFSPPPKLKKKMRHCNTQTCSQNTANTISEDPFLRIFQERMPRILVSIGLYIESTLLKSCIRFWITGTVTVPLEYRILVFYRLPWRHFTGCPSSICRCSQEFFTTERNSNSSLLVCLISLSP